MAATAHSLPSARSAWIEVQTENFTLFSSAGKRATLRIANDLEKLRSTLGQITTLELVSPLPTHIYVFKHDRAFTPYKPLYNGQPWEVGGVYFSRPHANYILIDGTPGMGATDLIYHEYVHYVFGNNLAFMPVWLSEGLAEYYSTFETSGDDAFIGKIIDRHLAWLRSNTLIPLDQLFAIDHASPDYNEGDRRGVFYAQSWALVHYMLTEDSRRRQLVDFLNRTAAGEAKAAAFQQAFGTGYEAVEKELRSYAKQRLFSYRRVEIVGDIDSTASVEPLGRADLLYHLGDALAIQGDRQAEAREHFQAALELEPAHARATAGLGFLAEQSGDWAQARQLYARAAESAADDFLIQFFYGRSLLPIHGGSDAQLARGPLERSLELRPGFPETWASLTLAYFGGSDEVPPRALEVARTAHRLQPLRTDIAFNLLSLYAMAGERQPAADLAEGYFRLRGDAANLARARRLVAEIDLQQAQDLASAREYQQALTPLERYEAATQPEHRSPWFAKFAQQVREAAVYDHFVESFDAATASYRAKEFQAAIDRLESLLSEAPSEDWRERVENLLRLTRYELGKQGG